MVRFIHTADWQLGKAPSYLSDEARARYSAARIDVIDAVAELAAERSCEFVVVSGDVFESNQIDRQVLVRALEKMRTAERLRFFLLPGNHDPLGAASIFASPIFGKHSSENVTVLDGSKPVQAAPGVELIGAPWHNKRPLADLVGEACDQLEQSSALRIVCGHGHVDSMWPERSGPADISLAALEERIESGLIHYVALGDRHSVTGVGGTGSVWYSGTPEPTAFDEVDPGKVLVVDLSHDHAKVEPVRVGTWRFRQFDWELSHRDDVEALAAELDRLSGKDRCIVRVGLAGVVSVAQKARLEEIEAHYGDVLGSLEMRPVDGSLAVVPDTADLDGFGLSGYARQALDDLSEAAQSPDPENAAAAQDALVLLYGLTRAAA